jgi:hypothetical protein
MTAVDARNEALTRADALEADGQLLDAIEALTAANRYARDRDVERRLAGLRNRAFSQLHEPGLDTWPPQEPDRFEIDAGALPEVRGSELDVGAIASGITNHGSLVVRELIPDDAIAQLRDDIRRAFAARAARREGETPSTDVAPWFEPFAVGREKAEGFGNAAFVRAIDSPPTLFDLIEAYTANGLLPLVAEHLGERAAVSANKCALRCIVPSASSVPGGGFHQDGAFLGEGIRALNVWLALTDCGGDADVPGLDVVPRRLPDVVPTGTEGAVFPWSASLAVVDAARGEVPVVRPEFAAGDALLFDELLLHCTGVSPDMTRPRYAIECWFFAPSRYPPKHVPIVF